MSIIPELWCYNWLPITYAQKKIQRHLTPWCAKDTCWLSYTGYTSTVCLLHQLSLITLYCIVSWQNCSINWVEITTDATLSQWQVCVSFFCHAPLAVHSTKCRHQSPEWTILSHINLFIQGEVIGFQVLLNSHYPRSTRASWWSLHRGGSR